MSDRMLTDGSPVPDDGSHKELRPGGQQKGYIDMLSDEMMLEDARDILIKSQIRVTGNEDFILRLMKAYGRPAVEPGGAQVDAASDTNLQASARYGWGTPVKGCTCPPADHYADGVKRRDPFCPRHSSVTTGD
jgi:hypothetical protein